MPSVQPILLTRRQVAEATGLSERFIYTLTQRGELPHVRLGTKSVRYRPCDVDAMAARRIQSGPST